MGTVNSVLPPTVMALPPAVSALRSAADRGLDVGSLLGRTEARLANAGAYDAAWQRYVWPTDGLDGVQLAVFQVFVNPMIAWMWIGGVVLALGTGVCMWPSYSERTATVSARVPAGTRPA